MGIRGFYSYIQEFADAALSWHKLQNCKLIIDGNNLAHEIYSNSSGINSAFGGDYDKYATHIEIFFNKLLECNVESIVVMDGGYPMQRSKFKTVYCRMTDQMDTCRRVNPDNQSSMKIFPLMARSVFVCTIHKLGVRVLQADFEADDEIVVVAKELGAYVLSNDSDFYLFDVPFILLHSVNMRHVQTETKKDKISKFIPCYRFDIEKFSRITGVRRELMPLLAPLLGNDYFNAKTLIPFYESISRLQPKSKKISNRKKLIISVLKWLAQQQGSPDAILQKLMKRSTSDKGMRKTFEMYFPTSSYLTPWVTQHQNSCAVKVAHREANLGANSRVNFEEYFLRSQNIVDDLRCTCKSRCNNTILSDGELPDKFLRSYRLGLIPHYIVDFLTKNYFFTVPQIEEANGKESLYLSFCGLIKDIRALLWVTYARGNKNRTLETFDKNLSVPNSNVQSVNNSNKHKNCKKKPRSIKTIVNSEESCILQSSGGEEDKESNNSDKIRNESRKSSLEDKENCNGNELRCENRQSSEEKENSDLKSGEITNDTKNILRTNNEKGLSSNEKSKSLCEGKRFNNENTHEFDNENQSKLEVCITDEEICTGNNSLSFVVKKTSFRDDKDVSKKNKDSKLCDFSSESIKETHEISEQIDPIATLSLNFATSGNSFFNYNDMARNLIMNTNNCETSRNEIASSTEFDKSRNETLNVNSCNASENDISPEKVSSRKLFPESSDECNNERLIPNKNSDSCSDDDDINYDINSKLDEEFKKIETYVSSDEEGENEEGTLKKLRSYEILFIPPFRMFAKGSHSFKVEIFHQEDITLYNTLPSLFEIQTYTEEQKIELFYTFIDFKREFRTSLSIEFIILCICFWKQRFFRHTKLNNILSVLVCIIMFFIIDGKLGRTRYKRSPEEVASFQRKINNMKQSGKFGDPSSMSVEELIENLTKEECKLASFNMNNLHIFDSKVNRQNYDRCAIHSFSEFQATVHFLQFLNSLLYFPFPIISMDYMWSGTFCYNVLNWLNRTNDVKILLATIFDNNQRMEILYVKLYSLVEKLTDIPSVESTFNNEPSLNKVEVMRKKLGIKKIPTKRNKKKKIIKEKVEYSTEELLLLAENKFSALEVS